MRRLLAPLIAMTLLLVATGCAERTDIRLPALDASATRLADALVIRADQAHGFGAPGHVIEGAGEGAKTGLGYYIGGVGASGGEGAIIGLLLAPIGLPVSAAVGAGMAHSEEEADAAAATSRAIGGDDDLLKSIDRRVLAALGDAAGHWTCAEVGSTTPEPCPGHAPVAQITLRPAFSIQPDGVFDPNIRLSGSVFAIITLERTGTDAGSQPLLQAKWAYREDIGNYFALASDDGRQLRQHIEQVLDRLAQRIATDLYLDPAPARHAKVVESSGATSLDFPDAAAIRIDQGNEVVSITTHGVVRPKSSFRENCWIAAVDGKPTGHHLNTPSLGRGVMVRAGTARLDVTCITHPGSDNAEETQRSIEFTVAPGTAYFTDGITYERKSQ